MTALTKLDCVWSSMACAHSAPTTFAPPPSTTPFLIASFPIPMRPLTAPSRVPMLLSLPINANRSVLTILGDSEG